VAVVLFSDPVAFLAATADFRAAHPALTNVLGSVATGAAEGRRYSSEAWYAITDDAGGTVGCAIRTAPWPLAVSPMPAAAATALAAKVLEVDSQVPGVVGPRDVAEAITSALGKKDTARISMVELVRVLDSYSPPAPIVGSARPTSTEDVPFLIRWMTDFNAEAGLLPASTDELREALTLRAMAGALWLWVVAGQPVSMAGNAPLVTTPAGTVARIGPVYTPAGHRGNGYGTAVTAAVVEALQPRCDVIMLYTDATNPTSNGIYARLGFDVVGEVVEVVFA
jgi:predicted GNAT family acetyltransferase